MTRLSELDVCRIIKGAYRDGYPFDLVFKGETNDETWVGVKRFDNLDVVAFRGSTTAEDWFRNFCPAQVYRHGLGWLADSFVIGLDAAYANLLSVVGPNYIVGGHSRGAAEATDYAAMMTLIGRPPLLLMPLAPPRTGGEELRAVLSTVPTRAYGNSHDPVCAAPPWCHHPYPMIAIDEAPLPRDPWGPLKRHHIELYEDAIGRLSPMPSYEVPA